MTKKPSEKNKAWEKDRRDRLNKTFDELAKLLPKYDASIVWSKIEIIQKAITFVTELQSKHEDYLKAQDPKLFKEYEDFVNCIKFYQERNAQLTELLKKAKVTLPPVVLPQLLVNKPELLPNVTNTEALCLQKPKKQRCSARKSDGVPKKSEEKEDVVSQCLPVGTNEADPIKDAEKQSQTKAVLSDDVKENPADTKHHDAAFKDNPPQENGFPPEPPPPAKPIFLRLKKRKTRRNSKKPIRRSAQVRKCYPHPEKLLRWSGQNVARSKVISKQKRITKQKFSQKGCRKKNFKLGKTTLPMREQTVSPTAAFLLSFPVVTSSAVSGKNVENVESSVSLENLNNFFSSEEYNQFCDQNSASDVKLNVIPIASLDTEEKGSTTKPVTSFSVSAITRPSSPKKRSSSFDIENASKRICPTEWVNGNKVIPRIPVTSFDSNTPGVSSYNHQCAPVQNSLPTPVSTACLPYPTLQAKLSTVCSTNSHMNRKQFPMQSHSVSSVNSATVLTSNVEKKLPDVTNVAATKQVSRLHNNLPAANIMNWDVKSAVPNKVVFHNPGVPDVTPKAPNVTLNVAGNLVPTMHNELPVGNVLNWEAKSAAPNKAVLHNPGVPDVLVRPPNVTGAKQVASMHNERPVANTINWAAKSAAPNKAVLHNPGMPDVTNNTPNVILKVASKQVPTMQNELPVTNIINWDAKPTALNKAMLHNPGMPALKNISHPVSTGTTKNMPAVANESISKVSIKTSANSFYSPAKSFFYEFSPPNQPINSFNFGRPAGTGSTSQSDPLFSSTITTKSQPFLSFPSIKPEFPWLQPCTTAFTMSLTTTTPTTTTTAACNSNVIPFDLGSVVSDSLTSTSFTLSLSTSKSFDAGLVDMGNKQMPDVKCVNQTNLPSFPSCDELQFPSRVTSSLAKQTNTQVNATPKEIPWKQEKAKDMSDQIFYDCEQSKMHQKSHVNWMTSAVNDFSPTQAAAPLPPIDFVNQCPTSTGVDFGFGCRKDSYDDDNQFINWSPTKPLNTDFSAAYTFENFGSSEAPPNKTVKQIFSVSQLVDQTPSQESSTMKKVVPKTHIQKSAPVKQTFSNIYSAESLIAKKDNHRMSNAASFYNQDTSNTQTDYHNMSNYIYSYPNTQTCLQPENDYLGASGYTASSTVKTTSILPSTGVGSTATAPAMPPYESAIASSSNNYFGHSNAVNTNDPYDPTYFPSNNYNHPATANWNPCTTKGTLGHSYNQSQIPLVGGYGAVEGVCQQNSNASGNLTNFNLSSICPEIDGKHGSSGW